MTKARVKYSLGDVIVDSNVAKKHSKGSNTAFKKSIDEVDDICLNAANSLQRIKEGKEKLEQISTEINTVEGSVTTTGNNVSVVEGVDETLKNECGWIEDELYRQGCYFTEGAMPSVPGAAFIKCPRPTVDTVDIQKIDNMEFVKNVAFAIGTFNGKHRLAISHNGCRDWSFVEPTDLDPTLETTPSNYFMATHENTVVVAAQTGNRVAVYRVEVLGPHEDLDWVRLGGDDIELAAGHPAIYIDNLGHPFIGGTNNKFFIRLDTGHWISRGAGLVELGTFDLTNGAVKVGDNITVLPKQNLDEDAIEFFFLTTSDGGKTWEKISGPVGLAPVKKRISKTHGGYEWVQLEHLQSTGNGFLYIYHAVHGVHYSKDLGHSWYRCQSVPGWFDGPCPPSTSRLDVKGRYIVTLNGRKEYCFSVDGGFTWRAMDVAKIIGLPIITETTTTRYNRNNQTKRSEYVEQIFVSGKKVFTVLEKDTVAWADIPSDDMNQAKKRVVLQSADETKEAVISFNSENSLVIEMDGNATTLMRKDTGEFIAAGDVKGDIELVVTNSRPKMIN